MKTIDQNQQINFTIRFSGVTTTIYQELPESEVRDVLKRTGEAYDD